MNSGAEKSLLVSGLQLHRQAVSVAFLRGINVGGNTIIKMAELKKAFESLGFTKVVPVLASGNMVFEAPKTDSSALKRHIEEKLEIIARVKVVAILRTGSQIRDLIKSHPFKDTKITAQKKLHVTFLADAAKSGEKFPRKLPSKDFEIVQISAGEICSAVDLTSKAGTSELMRLLEKEFGKNITTRTWNTVLKIGKLMES